MNKSIFIFTVLFFGILVDSFAQNIDAIINVESVKKIEDILSADDMQGRAVFTPGIEKAAAFITDEFRTIGLQPFTGTSGYRQEFNMVRSTPVSVAAVVDGNNIPAAHILSISSSEHLHLTQDSGYTKVIIKKGDNFFAVAFKYLKADKNCLVVVDTSFARMLQRFGSFVNTHLPTSNNVIFVLATTDAGKYDIAIEQTISELKLANIAGMLPGKSRKDEFVIFSGHYDHLGIGKPDDKQDSIFNGANDDASGTTAVIMLARYFKALNNNERTLVFVAFTAEEIGEYGSGYFSKKMDPVNVAAMFNIEMIGTQSKWGLNSAYITGYEKTDMGKILGKNLEGSKFTFYPDPYTAENLFYRSDNASLAKQGVPAHTISTSKMDSEPNYHKQSDEIGTLDITNMTEVIKSIALSATGIVSGKDTPSRVDTSRLQ